MIEIKAYMSSLRKETLNNMLQDVVKELDLSDVAIEKHGQCNTSPADLVRILLKEKDLKIKSLENRLVEIEKSQNRPCPVIENDKYMGLVKELILNLDPWYIVKLMNEVKNESGLSFH